MTKAKAAQAATPAPAIQAQDNGAAFPAIRSAGSLIKEIAKYKTDAKGLEARLIELCNQSLLHFHNYGDATCMSAIVDAMPASQRAEAFKGWARKFAPVKWDDETKQFKKDGKSTVPQYLNNDGTYNDAAIPVISEALKTPFFTLFKEVAIPVYDQRLPAQIEKILKDYANAQKNEGIYADSPKFVPTAQVTEAIELIRKARLLVAA
jgi:hypothetical protein